MNDYNKFLQIFFLTEIFTIILCFSKIISIQETLIYTLILITSLRNFYAIKKKEKEGLITEIIYTLLIIKIFFYMINDFISWEGALTIMITILMQELIIEKIKEAER